MKRFLLLLLVIFIQAEGKIRLLTFHYNRPDFIEYQKLCLDRFLHEKDEYELIVFNDAPTKEMAKKIENACRKMRVKCVRYKQEWHTPRTQLVQDIAKWAKLPGVSGLAELNSMKEKHPSIRHCNVIQYALDHYGYDHDDIVGLLDGDMFLIRRFSIRSAMRDYQIVGSQKFDETRTVPFFWVALSFVDMKNLPNKRDLKFGVTMVNNHITDSGGASHHYTKKYPHVPIKYHTFLHTSSLNGKKFLGKRRLTHAERRLCSRSEFNGQFHMGAFLHYLRSSFRNDYNPAAPETKESEKKKTEPFKEFMDATLRRGR